VAAYYNEFDPKAAATLRELIRRGLIADGDVDERDLWDVSPDDLRSYTQVHLCAGIGVWSYALRRAGFPDDRGVWTVSCPCQPFSAAGKGLGFADERHLWPAVDYLIGERRPDLIVGEQVASKDGLAWIDLVQADLEGKGYAVGEADTCAAGFGAPHIRQRLYWVADAQDRGEPRDGRRGGKGSAAEGLGQQPFRGLSCSGLGDNDDARLEGYGSGHQAEGGRLGTLRPVAQAGQSGRVDDAERERFDAPRSGNNAGHDGQLTGATGEGSAGAGPANGHWRDADWLFCRDGKWRPVEPGTFPLAHGSAARVGRLRGYGNAIVAAQAQGFIEAFLESRHLRLMAMSEITNDKDIFA
jgi:DNA (cytosine-5)-methyltransferase 1